MKISTKITWVFATILMLLKPVFSQQPAHNLVPNSSFEEVISSGFDCPGFFHLNSPINPPYPYFDWSKVMYWQNPDGASGATPNGYNRWLSAFCNSDLPFEARTGTAWGQNQIYGNVGSSQNNDFGYFCSPIYPGLIPGHYYYVSFYTRWSNNLTGGYGNQWGALFSNDKVHQTNSHCITNVIPQVSEFTVSNSYEFLWHRTHGIFQATSWNDWINIGAFDPNSVINSWYALEDIIVIDLGEDACASEWLIENTVYDHTEEIFEAEDKIVAGYDAGFNDLNGPVTVPHTTDITYKAGNYVHLKDGFTAWYGSEFRAYVAPCGLHLPCSGGYYTTDISTGSNVSDGDIDTRWSLSYDPSNTYMQNVPLKRVVQESNSEWVYSDDPANYDWINPDGDESIEYPGDYYGYELHFNIPDASLMNSFEIHFDHIAVDNSLRLFLNGTELNVPVLDVAPSLLDDNFLYLNGPCVITQHNSGALVDLLQTGDNVLLVDLYTRFTVQTSESKTGLMIDGRFNYATCHENQITITETSEMGSDGRQYTSEKKNSINIRPNPNDGNFTLFIESPLERSATIKITDISGHVFFTQILSLLEGSNQIQLSNIELPSGIYFIKVEGFDEPIKMIITK